MMNKRVLKEFGENVAEKRGGHWVLYSFVVETWGNTRKEIENQTGN